MLCSLQLVSSLDEIPDIKKLQGYKTFYRIRIGDYRIGMDHEKPKIVVMTILQRGSIYKRFPPQ